MALFYICGSFKLYQLRQLSRTKDATQPYNPTDQDFFHTSVEGGGDTMGEAATVVKLKWMWADAGVSSKLAQVM